MPRHSTATDRLANIIDSALFRHREALRDGPLVLAVSGGTDSLAMLLAVARIPTARRPKLMVAHFSHGLRPTAEPAEEALVRRVASALSVPMVHGRGNASRSEAAAREARYTFLAQAAHDSAATAVTTAHTMDDQAETLLLRLTRGSGARGAGATRELTSRSIGGRPILILRPLLSATRAMTETVCREADVTPAEDVTNQSTRYARNRVRLHVLPELRRINPNVMHALARYALNAQEDDDLLEALAAQAIAGKEIWSNGNVEWSRKALKEMAGALRARVLQAAWRRIMGEGAALSYAQVQGAQELITQDRGGEIVLSATRRLVVEQDTCRMEAIGAELSGFEHPLSVPGTVRTRQWLIKAEAIQRQSLALDRGPWQGVLDAERITGQLSVRSRRKGDHFQPLGQSEAARLQDVLVNARIPRTQRATWPLVVGDQGIAWVPGIRVADWAKVTGSTVMVLLLSAERTA